MQVRVEVGRRSCGERVRDAEWRPGVDARRRRRLQRLRVDRRHALHRFHPHPVRHQPQPPASEPATETRARVLKSSSPSRYSHFPILSPIG